MGSAVPFATLRAVEAEDVRLNDLHEHQHVQEAAVPLEPHVRVQVLPPAPVIKLSNRYAVLEAPVVALAGTESECQAAGPGRSSDPHPLDLAVGGAVRCGNLEAECRKQQKQQRVSTAHGKVKQSMPLRKLGRGDEDPINVTDPVSFAPAGELVAGVGAVGRGDEGADASDADEGAAVEGDEPEEKSEEDEAEESVSEESGGLVEGLVHDESCPVFCALLRVGVQAQEAALMAGRSCCREECLAGRKRLFLFTASPG